MDTGIFDKKVLIFAGTFEGHALARVALAKGYPKESLDFSVATDYGSEVISDVPGINILEGRLDRERIKRLIKERQYELVIDATHPYATEVTANIKAVCSSLNTEYIRLERSSGFTEGEGVIPAASIEEAVNILNGNNESILLTTGSKDLSAYTKVNNLQERVYARILPTEASLKSAEAAGFPSKNIIAMQGPFSRGMNVATMEQYGCRWIVTKDTGKPGGYDEKVSLAQAGYKVIVILRPDTDRGLSFEEVIERMDAIYEG